MNSFLFVMEDYNDELGFIRNHKLNDDDDEDGLMNKVHNELQDLINGSEKVWDG